MGFYKSGPRARHVYTPMAPTLADLESRSVNLKIAKGPGAKLGVAFAKDLDSLLSVPVLVRRRRRPTPQ